MKHFHEECMWKKVNLHLVNLILSMGNALEECNVMEEFLYMYVTFFLCIFISDPSRDCWSWRGTCDSSNDAYKRCVKAAGTLLAIMGIVGPLAHLA